MNAAAGVARCAATRGGSPPRPIQEEDGASARVAAIPFLRIKLRCTVQTNAPQPTRDECPASEGTSPTGRQEACLGRFPVFVAAMPFTFSRACQGVGGIPPRPTCTSKFQRRRSVPSGRLSAEASAQTGFQVSAKGASASGGESCPRS